MDEFGYTTYIGNGHDPDPILQTAFDATMTEERRHVAHHISKALKAQHSFIAFGPFCSLQVDSWTHDSCGFVYAVASVSFITQGFDVQRFGLDVQSFRQGRFTAPAVASWLERITEEYFQTLTPAQVYIACTIGEGEPLEEAVRKLNIPIINCVATRMNKAFKSAITSSGPHTEALAKLSSRAKEMVQYLTESSRRNLDLAALQVRRLCFLFNPNGFFFFAFFSERESDLCLLLRLRRRPWEPISSL